MYCVIKYGGSLLFNADGTFHIDRIKHLIKVLTHLSSEGVKIIMAVGGGRPARQYIKTATDLGASQASCDKLGMMAASQNAALLATGLGNSAYPLIPSTLDEAIQIISTVPDKILLLGGITPGQSTDAVAAIMAELVSAQLLIRATDVDGIYDKDPQQYSDAIITSHMTFDELIQLVQKSSQEAGGYALFDLLAAQIVKRSKIRTRFINGQDPDNILRAVNDEKIGTLVEK